MKVTDMGIYLGIDTSNYTTSAAVYDSVSNVIIHKRKFLPVKSGQLGLRQSDAVFHHTQQFHEIYRQLSKETDLKNISAVGVSSKPRPLKGSYMPCFTVGLNIAHVLADTLKVPLYEFSHQEGHIAAAVFSCNRAELLNENFAAFHLSGGTTEALMVSCEDGQIRDVSIVGETLDLNAGQAVDRAGVMMGLSFPCGKEIETLALEYYRNIEKYESPEKAEKYRKNRSKKKLFNIKTSVKDGNCCLSGIENKCAQMLKAGASREKTAACCLAFIEETLADMTEEIIEKYGKIPLIYAGGVMSNSIIRERMERDFECSFASAEFSSDNAGGTAYLAGVKHKKAGDI